MEILTYEKWLKKPKTKRKLKLLLMDFNDYLKNQISLDFKVYEQQRQSNSNAEPPIAKDIPRC